MFFVHFVSALSCTDPEGEVFFSSSVNNFLICASDVVLFFLLISCVSYMALLAVMLKAAHSMECISSKSRQNSCWQPLWEFTSSTS